MKSYLAESARQLVGEMSCKTSSSPYSSPAVDKGIARQPFSYKTRKGEIDIRKVMHPQVEVLEVIVWCADRVHLA